MKKSLILFACVAGSCFGQQPAVDKIFHGVWNLDMAKSNFGGRPSQKGSQVFVNQNGFVFANQDPPPGMPQAGGVAFAGKECYALGANSSSCTADMTNPRRPVVSTKSSDGLLVKSEVESQGETTMRVKQTVTPPGGSPMVFDLVYTRVPQPPSAPAKK